MAQLNVYLCVFLLVLAVQFGNSENNTCNIKDIEKIAPGSDKTNLSILEKILEGLLKPVKDTKHILDNIIGHIHKPKNNTQSNKKTSFGNILQRFKKEVRFIAPGTRWCGDGDIARNKDDLGRFNETDACCRAHDNCKNDIEAGKNLVNLQNNGIFTRSACTCDNAFYNCLKKASSIISYKIGVMYFDILRPQCFQCDCPTDGCKSDDSTECKDHCLKYEWVNNPLF